MGQKKTNLLLCIMHGAVGITSQLIILRELPQIFYGNELSFGIILTSWLFWAALGSATGSKITSTVTTHAKWYYLGSVLSTIFLCGTIVGIRCLRMACGLLPGEIVSIPLIIGLSFILVFPFSFIQGYLFTVLPALIKKSSLSANVNSVYMLESFGAFLGCICTYFFCFPYLDTFQTLFTLIALRFATLALFFLSEKKNRFTCIASFSIMCACVYLAIFSQWNIFFFQKAFAPLPVIGVEESEYGSIVVTQQGEHSQSFFENGLLMFTTDDQRAQEETTQFPLLAHPKPRSVLLLGGGVTGCIPLILAHPTVQKVTYVELDPHLIETAKKFTPATSLDDPRVDIIYLDPRVFLQNNTTEYDVVISYYPQPYTLQLNRLYSFEFFELIKRSLHAHGIFSFAIPSSESFINNEQALVLKTVRNTAQRSFAGLSIIPGNANVFLISQQPVNDFSAQELVATIKSRQLSLSYVNEFFLPTRLMPEKYLFLAERLNEVSNTQINRDLNPILYFYNFLLWSDVSYKSLSSLIAKSSSLQPSMIYIGISILFFLLLTLSLRTQNVTIPLMATVGFVGLTEISLEIIIVLFAQIILGNMYSFIALIIASYMLGLTCGAYLSTRHTLHALHLKSVLTLLIVIEACMVIFPLALLLLPHIFSSLTYSTMSKHIAFLLVSLCIGIIGGMQFPFVNTLYLRNSRTAHRKTGVIYAVDLLGSSVGAFFITVCIIPLFGITQTICILSFTHFLCILLLLFTSKFLPRG